MADIDGEGFLDFFASPSLPHINSGFNTNGSFTGFQAPPPPTPPDAGNDDDDWGDFMGPASRSQPAPNSTSLQFNFAPSNGFSSNPPPRSTSTAFDPFGFADSSSAGSIEPESNRIGSDSKGIVFEKPRGPLPLSLFGEEEEEGGGGGEEERGGSVVKSPLNASNVSLHQESSQDAVNGTSSDFKIVASEILGNLYAYNPQIKLQSASNSDTNGLHSVSKSETCPNGTNEWSDDEDDWEFHGAFSQDGVGERNVKEQGGSEGESTVVISQDQKAGQDASKSVVYNIESTNSHQFADLFTSQNGVRDRNSEVNVGTDFKATSFFPDAFMSVPLANGMEIGIANVTYPTPQNTNDDFDDFGEFMDATSETGSKNQKHHPTHEPSAVAHVQDENDVDITPESLWQPFPESVFSNDVVESNKDHQKVTDKPTFTPRNGTTIQGSGKSIQDLISHLYTQGQNVPSDDSSEKPAENGSCTIQKTMDSSYNSSWDFKDGVGVKEKLNDVVQKESDKLQDLQIFVDFVARLRDKLHFLASCLLEDAENMEAQEALKALQDDMGSEIHLEKNIPISGCLSDFIEALHGPTFQIIESEYLLSRRLALAEKDWKMAIKLLKETRLIAKILESGLGNDQSVYISTWSNIVNVCAQELRYGALIWKQAVENNLQIQILSNHRGQCYIQALGEIYRVVQLFGLSAKVYKPWILLNKGDQLSLFLVLEECSALWSSSGLEEAFWNLLGSVDSVSGHSVEALVESVKHIQEIDVLVVQECVFFQQRSICQLSLLPEQVLPELKLVSWNKLRCFLKVANCWANLISHEPPVLPQLRVA